MTDMTGRTVVVTGATSGIGFETALQLGRMGARVLAHGRTLARAGEATAEMERLAGGGDFVPVAADLSSVSEIRDLAAQIERATARLDVLLNNAGVYMHERVLTASGAETTFAVNHLAPYALTSLLNRILLESAPARVITVSSVAHFRGRIPLGDPSYETGYDAYAAYADSKLANVLFAYEAAARFAGTDITSNTLHPGVIDTRLLRQGFPGQTGSSPEMGAATSVYLASSPEVEDTTGRYFVNQHPAHPAPAALDHGLRESLWQLSEELTGVPAR
jgi:retinol dehydrogenase-14